MALKTGNRATSLQGLRKKSERSLKKKILKERKKDEE